MSMANTLQEAEQLYLAYKLDEAFVIFQKLAEAGNGRAMYFLGEYYAHGLAQNVPKNPEKSAFWRREGAKASDVLASLNVAYGLPNGSCERVTILQEWFQPVLALAEAGDVFAQHEVGDLYWYGKGIEKNKSKAIAWYQVATDEGYWRAAETLADIYYEEELFETAFHLYKRLARQGMARAQRILGAMYYTDDTVIQDHEKAFYWTEKAAAQGDIVALWNMGYAYEHGKGKPQDYSKAARWYEKAAQQGHDDAQFRLGECYEFGIGVAKDYQKAAIWYQKAAEQGHAESQGSLGRLCDKGYGVAKDGDTARAWYRKAAEQGDDQAQYDLGMSYKRVQQYCESVRWFQMAAEQGLAGAQDELGDAYCQGRGVAQDYEKAYQWYYQAGNQGMVNSQYRLGWLYEMGKGVRQNYDEAIHWYSSAAEKGNSVDAKVRLHHISAYLIGNKEQKGKE